jgi:hypothetical protein
MSEDFGSDPGSFDDFLALSGAGDSTGPTYRVDLSE